MSLARFQLMITEVRVKLLKSRLGCTTQHIEDMSPATNDYYYKIQEMRPLKEKGRRNPDMRGHRLEDAITLENVDHQT